MAGTLGKFQTVGFTSWKGLTKENHLGAIFGLAPQKATNLMVQLLAAHYGKTLDTFLSQFPTKEFEDDSDKLIPETEEQKTLMATYSQRVKQRQIQRQKQQEFLPLISISKPW